MEKIKYIVAEGQKLAEKRTWLEKGFADLMEKMNADLEKIPGMEDESDISYLLREFDYSPNKYNSLGRKVYARLVFGDGADCKTHIALYLKKETYDNWEEDEIVKPVTKTIREFAKKLPEMVAYFRVEIEKRNTENQTAMDIIASLASKIR